MSYRNSTKCILLGLFMILGLHTKISAQSTDSVSTPSSKSSATEEQYQAENSKESNETAESEKPNPKLVVAICLFIITTTLLLYHVRSK